MDDDESNFSYKTYLWGIVGFIVFELIYTPLVFWVSSSGACRLYPPIHHQIDY